MKKYLIFILFSILFTCVFSQVKDNTVIYSSDTIFPKDTSELFKYFYGDGGIYLFTNKKDFYQYYRCNDSLKIDFNKKIVVIYLLGSTGKDYPKWKQKIYKDEFGNTIVFFDVFPKIKMHSAGRLVHGFYIIDKPDLDKTVFMINNRFGRIFSFKYQQDKTYIKYPVK